MPWGATTDHEYPAMNKAWRLFRYDWPLHLVLLLTNWLPDNVVFLRLRGAVARFFLGACGANLRLGRNVTFYNPSQARLGRDVYIAYGCWIGAVGEVEIGDEVMFGPYVVLSAGNHTRLDGSYRYGAPERLCIAIGKGCWIGAHVTVLGGVTLGSGCIVGSNACVTRGVVPAGCFLAGVPAEIKKELD